MATILAEGRSLGTNLLADIRTAILTSSDWSRPNAGAKPNLVKATTTRGAEIVLDLEDAALTNQKMQWAAYTSYDGTTFGDKRTGWLWTLRTNTGTLATNYYYWFVSAGKEHIFISIDGPRWGDPAGVAGWGGARGYLFIDSLTPYYDNTLDPAPVVVVGTSDWNNSYGVDQSDAYVFVSRNVANTVSWSAGVLQTLSSLNGHNSSPNREGLDGKMIFPPFVFFDDVDGYRGRLTSLYYGGWGETSFPNQQQFLVPAEQDFVFDGKTYRSRYVSRGNGDSNGTQIGGAFGWYGTNDAPSQNGKNAIILVPVN